MFTELPNTRSWKAPNLKSTVLRRERVWGCLWIGHSEVGREVCEENEAVGHLHRTSYLENGVFDPL